MNLVLGALLFFTMSNNICGWKVRKKYIHIEMESGAQKNKLVLYICLLIHK